MTFVFIYYTNTYTTCIHTNTYVDTRVDGKESFSKLSFTTPLFNKYTPNKSLKTLFNKFLGLFNSSTYNNLLFKQQDPITVTGLKDSKELLLIKTHCYRYLNELSQRYHICKNVSSNFRHKVIYISRIVDSCPYNALYPKDIRGTF